jgi:hypothetical protein
MTIDEVVYVVPVRDWFMATARSVDMILAMFTT